MRETRKVMVSHKSMFSAKVYNARKHTPEILTWLACFDLHSTGNDVHHCCTSVHPCAWWPLLSDLGIQILCEVWRYHVTDCQLLLDLVIHMSTMTDVKHLANDNPFYNVQTTHCYTLLRGHVSTLLQLGYSEERNVLFKNVSSGTNPSTVTWVTGLKHSMLSRSLCKTPHPFGSILANNVVIKLGNKLSGGGYGTLPRHPECSCTMVICATKVGH